MLIVTLDATFSKHLLKKWHLLSLLFHKHWLCQYLLFNLLYMYQIVIIIWSTNQVSKLAYISFLLLCLRQVHLFFFGYTLLLAVSRTICSVVTCEGGNLSLSYYPLPSQNHGSSRTSPLGLTTLKRKNHPIKVTLGGIGSNYASLSLQSLSFILATNCVITAPKCWKSWS